MSNEILVDTLPVNVYDEVTKIAKVRKDLHGWSVRQREKRDGRIIEIK